MARINTEAGTQWAKARGEWATGIPFSLMLLVVLVSPLLYDIFQ